MKLLSPVRLLMLMLGLLALASTARADCTGPTGIAGDIIYSSNYNVPAYCNGSSWVTLAGGTIGGGGGGGATPAGSLNDVQFNNGSGLGADTGNFTYSSGLLQAPNISTSAITASDLGTFGSALVNGGVTVTGQASITTISTSLIQVGDNGASCTSGVAGGVRYNSTSNTIDYCSGSAWLSLGPSATTPVTFLAQNGGSDQTVTTNTWTKIGLTTEAYDTNNNFSNSTFTPTIPGYYLMYGALRCKDAASLCDFSIRKNGSIVVYQSQNASNGYASTGATVIVYMNGSTDYAEAWGLSNGGTTISGGGSLTYFGGVLISPQGGGSGSTSTPAGSSNDIQFNSGGLLAADTGNFTYASSTLVTPKISTGALTVSGASSLSTISTSLIQVGNSGASCTSGLAGGVRYNSTSNTIDYCSGSAWLSLGPSATVPISWSANKSATQTLSISGWNKITGWSKDFDTNGDFGSDAYTVSVPGKYLLTASLRVQMAGAGTISVGIYKNGAPYRYDTQYSTATGPNVAPVVAVVADAVAGDKFEVYAWTGNTSNSVYADASANYFTGALLSPQDGGSGGTSTPAGSTNDIQFNSGGLLAADTGNFTYATATGTLSTTTISTTRINVAPSSSTVISLNGGSGNMISSGSAVVSTSSAGSITLSIGGNQRMLINSSGVSIGASAPNAQFLVRTDTTDYSRIRVSNLNAAGGSGYYFGTDADPAYSSFIIANNTSNTSFAGAKSINVVNAVGPLAFFASTGGVVERMRIDTSGYVGVGTTNPQAPPNPGVNIQPVGAIAIGNNAGASGSWFAGFYRSGTAIGSISQNGTTAVSYNTTSDRRVKDDITNSREGLQKLMQLPVRDFTFKGDPSHTIVTGFIAQELEKVFPDAVTTNGDNGETPLKDKSKPWAVDYGRVTPLIVKAVQELDLKTDEEVNALKAANGNLGVLVKAQQRQIDALTAANDNLEKRVNDLETDRRASGARPR